MAATQPIDTPTTVYDGTVHGGQITIGHRYRISVGARQPANEHYRITGTTCNVFIDGRHIRRPGSTPPDEPSPPPRPRYREGRPRHA